MVGRLEFAVVTLALAFAPDAKACSISLTPSSFISPSPNTFLGINDAFLVTTRDGEVATARAGAGAPVALKVVQAFRPHHPLAASVAFLRPAQPLEPETDYVVETEGGGVSVPFRTSAEPPRALTELSFALTTVTVPEQTLTSGLCYDGPLEGRPFTRVADLRVTASPPAQLLVSVNTLDSVSGELIEQLLLLQAPSADGHLQLPLPEGLADCLRVRAFDFAGTLLTDEGSLCVTPEGTTWGFAAEVFVSKPASEGQDEPPGASRSSKGCQLAPAAGTAGSWAGIFALGCLLRARRRSAH